MPAELLYDIIQGSPEWLSLKRGVMGSSNAHRLLTPDKRKTYLRDLISARLCREHPSQVVTAAMQRGIDLEDSAASRFELETGFELTKVGFAWRDGQQGWVGCSPDRLVNNDAILEIKCPTSHVHTGYLISKTPPPEYYAQMQWIMWVLERPVGFFVSFDPRMRTPHDCLIVPIVRDEPMVGEFEKHSSAMIESIQTTLRGLGE